MPKSARKTRRQLLAEKAMVQRRLINKANALANPLETLHKFHEYITKDNNMIKLACVKAKDAPSDCLSWILNIMERNMKKMYEQSSWGWNATEKQTELTEEMAWYLVASCDDKFLGFSHFRFDIDNGDVVLYCGIWHSIDSNLMRYKHQCLRRTVIPIILIGWSSLYYFFKIPFSEIRFIMEQHPYYELQLEPSTRRKGLGRFMMSTLESMAYHNQMTKVVLTVFKHNSSAIQFFYALGYKLDNSYPPVSDLDYIILSKQNLCG